MPQPASKTVVTRFAPSPTGYLHIGSARTALFSWAYARHTGGQFLLRIEDTDRERSTEAAVQAIYDGLTWLGLEWDGPPTLQFSRAARHAEIARELLARGQAYYCYCSPEELAEMRETARAKGLPPRYNGMWRDRDPSEAPEGVAPVIRIKAPLTGEIVVNDHVQGEVVFKTENLDDFIILRSDGTPTYMLAVVVDDHDMGVTHIIRGDDHLTNAARQIIIYNGMGWDVPEMAHIPLIHGPDGAKLSKRHGALGVGAYRQMGYLPEAMLNYLARLGWSHGDDELFSIEQMIEWFSLEGLNKGAARFDFVKLENVNGHYIRAASPDYLYGVMVDTANEIGRTTDHAGLTANKATVLAALPELQPRAKTVLELIDLAQFIYAVRPIAVDATAAEQLTAETRGMLAGAKAVLEELSDWSVPAIDGAIRAFAEGRGLKLGKVAQPLRVALTGRTVSPGIFEVMVLIGKAESLARIGDQANA
ncbi:MAG: glutamate--tRNA ligase [Devosia sp. 67-54]|mgnify:CR=1 FL=1|uniref:glutamate--tRNA ligase n=1 Tax=unclassified Devosia TaxID=196773 RepID=UPI00095D2279|nr:MULTISPECIES: glutamate--tRNA ligase [unclassified Devosia]MBN9304317.1 glutamate--tRNA ligase [Devosia sp.]OJX18124.1 MAG: glutamate--tRNA ligase [Devosia sp. 67-54]